LFEFFSLESNLLTSTDFFKTRLSMVVAGF
jgi:hypothetical protein